ncbi:hypothetical protein ABZ135_18530 [Streptomyces sp. NPDC006339]|uniref:hypothetical protein n=1 Tax=Streptomyces sp. NPDC006339 TaxID=3156755 RepID=UPI0033ACF2FC
MTDETDYVNASLIEARAAITKLIDLYFDNVPVDELEREQIVETLHEGMSDELERLYRLDHAAGVRDATRQAAAQQPADEDTIGLCGHCGVPRESHHHGYVSTDDAIAAAPHRISAAVGGQDATQPTTPPLRVWQVIREDEHTAYNLYGTEDDAKRGSINCWLEEESPRDNYSWRPFGDGLELLVDDKSAGILINRLPVYGRHFAAARAAGAES